MVQGREGLCIQGKVASYNEHISLLVLIPFYGQKTHTHQLHGFEPLDGVQICFPGRQSLLLDTPIAMKAHSLRVLIFGQKNCS